ncbi:hypothetical protein DV515_00005907 [Chloebia gouldiae]|uniref:RNase H type-1 domain-containing protein n=1 Tax=Chloebia gouldiae TaxID=44316 RepID=A0A3L8SLX3_CHLGU|nr:hypothetical protein DV515_00005907 [Chloebia gouldiae]
MARRHQENKGLAGSAGKVPSPAGKGSQLPARPGPSRLLGKGLSSPLTTLQRAEISAVLYAKLNCPRGTSPAQPCGPCSGVSQKDKQVDQAREKSYDLGSYNLNQPYVSKWSLLLTFDSKAWEKTAKGYGNDPIGVPKKLKFMVKQHLPNWADMQLLLDALTETEKLLVLKVAKDLAEDACVSAQEDIKDVFPLQDPMWDPNEPDELAKLKRYQDFITTLDPRSEEGIQQLINLFLGQSTGDIRRKLQKIRGPNSRDLETLLDEAWRVFSNQEEGYKQGMKKLVAVVREEGKEKCEQDPPRRGPPQGYQGSQKKAQMVKQTVIYLCYKVSAGQRTLGQDRKEAICQTLRPQTVKELRTFLGMMGWCRLWIYNNRLLRFLKYQAILVEQDDVEIVVTNIVNPASFLSGSMGKPVIHDCLETIEATYSSHPDLKDIPLEGAETWFKDESSYVISRKRHAGYTVTTSRDVIESGPLSANTYAQEAEIIALTRALELAKEREINIYTDSRYAFGKETGLSNSQGKNIKHAQEILKLLDAVQLPEKVAIMHIRAHPKVSSELEEGNMLADREAKHAANGEVFEETVEATLIPDRKISIEGKPVYNKKDKKLIKAENANYNQEGWVVTEEGRLVVPSYLLKKPRTTVERTLPSAPHYLYCNQDQRTKGLDPSLPSEVPKGVWKVTPDDNELRLKLTCNSE